MAKVTIGDKDYIVRELNFIAIEKCWATIQKTMIEMDPIQAVGSAVEIIGAALQEEPEFKREDFGIDENAVLQPSEIDAAVARFLKRQLKAGQISAVQHSLDQIIEEAGLRPPEGEALSPGASPGTETLTQSLLSSSRQDAKAGTGTE